MRTHLTIDEKALQKAERALETIPGGMEVNVTAVAHKEATVTVTLNGKTVEMTKQKCYNILNRRDINDYSIFS